MNPLQRTTSKAKYRCPVKHCRNHRGANGGLCSRHQMQQWRANNPIKAAFASLRDSARGRKIQFAFTIEEFTDFCTRTGYLDARGNRDRNALQVDRIDHTQGYTAENIQPLTLAENSYKGNMERWHGIGRTRGEKQTEAML